MDSGSGSLQSSSGADDQEYDSHHQQSPLFPPPPIFFNSSSSIPNQQSLTNFHYQNHLLPSFYDLPSTYTFNPDSSSNSFLNNLDVLRSEPTHHFKNNPPISDGSTQLNQIPIRSTPSSSSGALHPKVNTKKRTRASRRAPTTVLTTDTTNFRAMVQEFTGIPSPPFTSGGSSYSRRFDLFGLVRTNNSTATSLEGSGLGVYPSRSKMTNEGNNVGGVFSFQSGSGQDFNTNCKEVTERSVQNNIDGSSSSGQQLVVLQNDETAWRGTRGVSTTAATATVTAATAGAVTRSNNNNNNAANLDSGYNIMA